MLKRVDSTWRGRRKVDEGWRLEVGVGRQERCQDDDDPSKDRAPCKDLDEKKSGE